MMSKSKSTKEQASHGQGKTASTTTQPPFKSAYGAWIDQKYVDGWNEGALPIRREL